MNDAQIDDLKQFIDGRISQSESRLSEKIEKLEQKVDDGFAGVADSFEATNHILDEHEHRVTKLEQKAA